MEQYINAIVSWLVNTKLELTCKYVSKVFIELTNNVELAPPNSPSNSNIALRNFPQKGKSYVNICDIKILSVTFLK